MKEQLTQTATALETMRILTQTMVTLTTSIVIPLNISRLSFPPCFPPPSLWKSISFPSPSTYLASGLLPSASFTHSMPSDGILDWDEAGKEYQQTKVCCHDTDGNGIPDFRDLDSDGEHEA